LDGCKSFDECPNEEDLRVYEQLHQEIDDDDEDLDEDEYNDGSEDEEVKEELKELKNSDDEEEVYGGDHIEEKEGNHDDGDEEIDIVGADEDIDEIQVGTKRKRDETNQVMTLQDKRKLKRQKKMKIHHYYRGDFYGKSSSFIIYQMCC